MCLCLDAFRDYLQMQILRHTDGVIYHNLALLRSDLTIKEFLVDLDRIDRDISNQIRSGESGTEILHLQLKSLLLKTVKHTIQLLRLV